jgi:hypothetical protein
MEVYKDTKTLRARITEYQNRSSIVSANWIFWIIYFFLY